MDDKAQVPPTFRGGMRRTKFRRPRKIQQVIIKHPRLRVTVRPRPPRTCRATVAAVRRRHPTPAHRPHRPHRRPVIAALIPTLLSPLRASLPPSLPVRLNLLILLPAPRLLLPRHHGRLLRGRTPTREHRSYHQPCCKPEASPRHRPSRQNHSHSRKCTPAASPGVRPISGPSTHPIRLKSSHLPWTFPAAPS